MRREFSLISRNSRRTSLQSSTSGILNMVGRPETLQPAYVLIWCAGELRTMFTQEHDEYMDAFFSKYPNPAISWIHDLGRGRYGLVSESLLSEAENATELVAKHV